MYIYIYIYIYILYQANISTKGNDTNVKAYIGILSLNWKFRYYNHLQSFKNQTLKNHTAWSKYYWYLKELELTPIINWKIIKDQPRQRVYLVGVIYA